MVALRLGMNNVRIEFENLGFGAMHPMRAERISAALRSARGNRKELVEKIGQQIETCLLQEGHEAEVVDREKHLYSIYQKMKSKRKSFSEIMDIYAFRIIVDSVDSCYRVLGCIHSLVLHCGSLHLVDDKEPNTGDNNPNHEDWENLPVCNICA